MSKNDINAKNKILDTATKVFAEKGFEGSRVDTIARKAGVPKSLIYYHFKSKDEILETLEKNLLDEYRSLINVLPDEKHQSKSDKIESQDGRKYIDFMLKNTDLLRVIFIESLKKSRKKPPVFEIVEMLIDIEDKTPGLKDSKNYDRDERLIAEFFTNIITNLACFCFREQWTKYFKIDNKKFSDYFTRIFIQTHGAYHKYHS